ncbi:MAG TPA: hypothetical protein VHY33_14980 [Thermoanaerobaculia bacterium]|jgi:hypothetical protein|nr:hypothetical protein [Thermoanaerobaculia bacterium]
MLGRVAVAISLIFLPVTAVPQCNLTQVASVPFRASYFDVAIDGNDLWAATSYGVSLYDRSVDPPLLIASLPLPGITRTVRAANGIAYAGSGSTLFIVRKNGRTLQLVRGIEAGATINDLLLTSLDLYVATSNGLSQWDLLDPANPSRTQALFFTSGANVRSLALSNAILFVADGDASVESFNIAVPSIPNGVGAIASLPGANAVAVNAGRLYVSDGQQTDIFANIDSGGGNAAKLATDSFGGAAITGINSSAIFAAGADRQVRAFDLSSAAAPVELWRVQLNPSGGNVNRIGRIATAPNRLYVAGGDLGLLTYDTTSFSAPFPLRSYATGATTSVVSLGTMVYVSRASGGITEFNQSSSGALTQARSWDSGNDIVRDGGDSFLLTTTGAKASFWALTPAVPTLVSSVTFRAPIASAVLAGTTGYFVLNEAAGNTLWSADLTTAAATAQQIALTTIKPSFIARSGSAFVLAELRGDDRITALSYFASNDFTKAPVVINVAGIATGGVTLSGTTAAVSTFTGVSLADFAAGTTTLLPQSSGAIARSLALNGTTLLEATDTSLIVWNTQTRTLTKQFALPAAPAAVHIAAGSSVADLATEDGITSIQLTATTRMPSLLFATNGNAYYKKLVAGSQRLYFFDGRNVDIFTNTMQSTGAIRTPLIVDVAASDTNVFTIQSNLTVTLYGREGNALATSTIGQSSDLTPSIASAGGAAWASIAINCQSSGCEGKTIVFDPKSAFAQTATMIGSVRDVVTSGTRAYVLTELPNEVRVVDISDPAHPSVLVSHPTEGTQPPRAIAFANNTVYVLGEKLYAYSPADLSKTGEQLSSYVTDPASGVTYVDQHLRADGACIALTGRQFSPQFLNGSPSILSPVPSIASPAAGRFIATQPGTFYFLTDYSLEIWSTKPLPPTARHRASR